MLQHFRRIFTKTDEQGLVEYALLAATISIGVLVAMRVVRWVLQNQFDTIGTTLWS